MMSHETAGGPSSGVHPVNSYKVMKSREQNKEL